MVELRHKINTLTPRRNLKNEETRLAESETRGQHMIELINKKKSRIRTRSLSRESPSS